MGSSYYLWCSCNLDLKGNFFHLAMDEDTSNPLRRMSSRTRKVASKMVAALASSDNRTQAALARLEALENDNAGMEMVEINSDDDASLDDEDQVYVKRQSKSTKRKTRQAKALENAKKAPRTFFELLHEYSVSQIGKPGIFTSSCAFLFESSSRPSKLHLPPPFLHCLWIHC
ncbi:SWR1 complex subunit 6-like isoform X3 [Actinidia eriantha]|uniref:SWR1 complex subunit 6-like isoform X3 n=1 Tax=Actinidia eriantha TaxID=165200 RepID=UPI002591088D|nr:SWR1 complex subunit 6-like isoform X3 [Actinidia eriantha]